MGVRVDIRMSMCACVTLNYEIPIRLGTKWKFGSKVLYYELEQDAGKGVQVLPWSPSSSSM